MAAGLASLVTAKSSSGDSVLVVVEPKRQDDFSIFFQGLKGKRTYAGLRAISAKRPGYLIDQGYELTFRGPKDEKPLIAEYDEVAFAHVVLFASETKSKACISLLRISIY